MSKQNPIILYVGDFERGRSLLTGDDVYWPADTLEALAMAITYLPDVVVIDTVPRVTFAHEVYYHLRTATFTTPMIVLTDTPERWHTGQARHILTLPLRVSADELTAAVRDLVEHTQPFGK